MNRNDFYKLIEQPACIDASYISFLEEINSKYPYFSSVKSLLAKAYFNEERVEFSDQLKNAAVYSGDRELLYDLIYHPVARVNLEEVKIEEINTPEIETNTNEVAEEQSTLVNDEIKKLEGLLFEIKLQLKQLAEVPIEAKPIDLSTIAKPELDTIKEEIKEIVVEPPVLEEKQAEVDIVIEQIKELPVENPNIKETIKVEEPLNFSEWLKFVRARGVPSEYEVKQSKLVKKEETSSEESNDNKKLQNALIDKFITEEPRIVPQKGVFYNPPEKARQSAEENEEIYSETLAKIYEMQGNLKKAIKAYEILSLKFPEKSAYFASLIEKCNKLLKEK